jgi:hypothetical protein
MWGIMSPRLPERCSEADGRRFPYGTSRYCQFTVRTKESLSGRFVRGVRLLGRCDLRQRDVVRPPIAPLGPGYIRLVHGLRTSTCFHFHTAIGFRRHSIAYSEQQRRRA